MSLKALQTQSKIRVVQRREFAELFGYESRNKYEICTVDGATLGYVAEQGSSLWQVLMRNYLGHWRTFELHIFDQNKNRVATVHNPFRFYFRELNVVSVSGEFLGSVKKQFAIFSKKFEIRLSDGEMFTVSSPIWKIWTFPVVKSGEEVACIRKKWSGALKEVFLDADNFEIEFTSPSLPLAAKTVIVAAGVYVDIQYFERKAGEQ